MGLHILSVVSAHFTIRGCGDLRWRLDRIGRMRFPYGGTRETAAIQGKVTVDDVGLGSVTVTVSGGPKDEEFSTTTNAAGMYDVGDLHAGDCDYSLAISRYDTEEYEFEVTRKSVSVGLHETATVSF